MQRRLLLAATLLAGGAGLLPPSAPAAPTITRHPASQTTLETYTTEFEAFATGRGALRYQWLKNGSPIANGTTQFLRLTRLRPSDAGRYSVQVTDADGSAESNAALLTITPPPDAPPIVSRQPGAQALLSGAADNSYWLPNTFTVSTESGQGAPILIQWFKDSVVLPGVTNFWLSRDDVQQYGPGEYHGVLYAPSGRTSTAPLRVTGTLTPVPVITQQMPQVLDVAVGEFLELAVVTNVTAVDATYVWRRGDTVLADQRRNSLVVSRASASDAGDYTVTITTAAGTVLSKAARVTVSPANARPILVRVPGDYDFDPRYTPGAAGVTAGQPIIAAQFTRNGVAIPADEMSFFGNSVQLTRTSTQTSHTYAGTITTAAGTATVPSFTTRFLDIGQVPRIVFQTQGGEGATTLKVLTRGEWPLRTEWFRDGVPISVTHPISSQSDYVDEQYFNVPGIYTVRTSNVHGSVMSAPMVLTAATDLPAKPRLVGASEGRLRNLSARARVDANSGIIAGFVIGGTGSKRVLIRAVGPALAAFNIARPLADPSLRVIDSSGREIAANADWSTGDADAIAVAAVNAGAFPLTVGSKDAALVTTLPAGAYTALVPAGGDGIALVEVYDLDASDSDSRFINLSVRARAATGEGLLVPGAVVSRAGLNRYLWRAIGPTLRDFGVSDAMADPRMTIVDDANRSVNVNDDWGKSSDATELSRSAQQVAAFALPAASADAAGIVPMVKGSWTALVTGAANSEGIVLVEVYELKD